jgi:hypothetical protein
VTVRSEPVRPKRPDPIILVVSNQLRAGTTVGEAMIEKWKETGLLAPSVFLPLLAGTEKALVLRN